MNTVFILIIANRRAVSLNYQCCVRCKQADYLACGVAACRIYQNQSVPQNDLQKDPEALNMQLHCILLSIDLAQATSTSEEDIGTDTVGALEFEFEHPRKIPAPNEHPRMPDCQQAPFI